MNIKEVAAMYGITESTKGMKNKEKAKEIIGNILLHKKCGNQMNWIKDTNICICPKCEYRVKHKSKDGKKEITRTYNVTRILSPRSVKFLADNYDSIEEKVEVK